MAIYKTQQYTGKGGPNNKKRIAFETAEHNKLMASIDAEDAARKQRMNEIIARQKANFPKTSPIPTNPGTSAPIQPSAPENPVTVNNPVVTPKPKVKTDAEWLATANAANVGKTFNNLDEVKAFQRDIGLTGSAIDGRFGRGTMDAYNKWKTQSDAKQKANAEGAADYQKKMSSVENEVTPTASVMSVDDFLKNNNKYFRKSVWDRNQTVTIGGEKYPVIVARGALGRNGIEGIEGINDNSFYAYDDKTGNLMELRSKLKGQIDEHQIPGKWFNITQNLTNVNKPTSTQYKTVPNSPGVGITYRKQGGTMNRINYFQQGGTTPQANIQEQVIALVQAAMQGDQEANNTIEQIMAKAKSGDPQATQLAQMIQKVAQEMQGQATMAKWGSKLGYIRSLKYARGGKTCKACQDGEKIEMEACGGKTKKKAKKKYFGGWI